MMIKNAPFRDPNLPTEARIDDLISRLTLDEKIAQLMHDAPAIERLDIPQYNWWNECSHSVARAGVTTVFPQSIGLAATFNTDLMAQIASVIGDEARAKHHESARQGVRIMYTGLTCWSPNINIFRDPRWGRGQETYGEDPFLTAQLAVVHIKALQGNDSRYLKAAGCAKHYAVHSGPEADRHRFNAITNERDLWDTYLPAFEACVKEADVEIVMTAYNRTNGEACSASARLLQHILRDQWGFEGHVVSDCGAVDDIYMYHGNAPDAATASAIALNAGCDLNCGETYAALGQAVEQGMVSETTIDLALRRLLRTRYKLGMFDPEEQVHYAQTPYSIVCSPPHSQLALQAARESLVLLKNENRFLPLDAKKLKTIAVIGPNADDVPALLGSYFGTPVDPVTPLCGLREQLEPGVQVLYAQGCPIKGAAIDYTEAVNVAQQADLVILVLGLSQLLEGEEGETAGVGDRIHIDLPPVQEALLHAIDAVGKPIVLVLLNGSPLAVTWAHDHVPAILEAWYPGQAGGTAIAEVLFGDYNPGGRLPITFPKSVDQLPPFESYDMTGRTYRYMREEPLYPFGYGLSYTEFSYRELSIAQDGENVDVSVSVENIGDRPGDEVTQLYISDVEASAPVPKHHLAGFQRVHLKPGESHRLIFSLPPRQFTLVTDDGQRVLEPGLFRISVGGGQPGFCENVLTHEWEIAAVGK
jgi:beta-glucosidase